MDDFKQYNPNIDWKKLLWNRTNIWKIYSQISKSMNSMWISQKLNYNILSSSIDNLLYWLIPSYSPLYDNWQILLWETNIEINDIEVLEKISNYLNVYFWDKNLLENYTNNITLLSQFSWLMIKDILNWDWDFNEYILWKLFRKWSWNKIKEYSQLESRLIDFNLKEIILFLENFLFKTTWEHYSFDRVLEKSFPFVSPWFEFVFIWNRNKEFKIVWWFIDDNLLKDFKINKNYFIFWININKFFLDKNYSSKPSNNSWKKIYIWNSINDILNSTSDIKISWNDNIILQPNKIELLSKDKMNLYLWNWEFLNDSRLKLKVDWDNLIINWDFNKSYYENIIDYLVHYYWWKLIEENENTLVIRFKNVDANYIYDKLINNEKSTLCFSKTEVEQIIWFEFNLIEIKDIFSRLWYDLSFDNDNYLLILPLYRKSLKQVLWEVIYYIFKNYKKTDIDYIKIKPIFENKWLILNDLLPNFFINNNFDEIDLSCLGNTLYKQFDLENIYWIEKIITWTNIKINKSLTHGLVEYIIKNRLKILNRWFSIEKLDEWFNLIFYINCKEKHDYFNEIYNYLITINDLLWIWKINLLIDNEINFLKKWQSFKILSEDEKVIWYLGKLDDNRKIKGNLYLCEIKINI